MMAEYLCASGVAVTLLHCEIGVGALMEGLLGCDLMQGLPHGIQIRPSWGGVGPKVPGASAKGLLALKPREAHF